ncbi:MAG: hypothetical protein WDN69_10265 [Aliidongia sp.]
MRSLLLVCATISLAAAGIARAEDAVRQPLYYQDPDGKPFYASAPKQAADGAGVPAGVRRRIGCTQADGEARSSHPLLPQSDGPAGHVA